MINFRLMNKEVPVPSRLSVYTVYKIQRDLHPCCTRSDVQVGPNVDRSMGLIHLVITGLCDPYKLLRVQ
jgi:hypothetical protein